MYLFTRRARVRAGNPGDAQAWAIGITERVRQITALDVSLFAGVFGPEVGTLAWTTMVPDLVALEAATDKLAVDGSYLADAAKGSEFAPDGADDRLLQLLHPQEPPTEAPAPFSYATVIDTICAPGKVGEGMALGVELAQRASAITGIPAAFFADATGRYGGVTWITGYADIQQLEAANAALAADAEWGAEVDRRTAGVYSADPSVTSQLLYRRIL